MKNIYFVLCLIFSFSSINSFAQTKNSAGKKPCFIQESANGRLDETCDKPDGTSDGPRFFGYSKDSYAGNVTKKTVKMHCSLIKQVQGNLIVSCLAPDGSVYGRVFLAREDQSNVEKSFAEQTIGMECSTAQINGKVSETCLGPNGTVFGQVLQSDGSVSGVSSLHASGVNTAPCESIKAPVNASDPERGALSAKYMDCLVKEILHNSNVTSASEQLVLSPSVVKSNAKTAAHITADSTSMQGPDVIKPALKAQNPAPTQ